MIEAKTALIRQDRKFLDTLTAVQTARLINVQCGTEENPSPATAEMCMAIDWSEKSSPEQPENETDSMSAAKIIDQKMTSWANMCRSGK